MHSPKRLWVAAAGLAFGSAQADMSFVLSAAPLAVPASLGFSNSTTAGTLIPGTIAPPLYNFLDSWSFALAENAEVSGLVASLNFTDLQGQVVRGIDNLQMRLVGPTPAGTVLVVGWQSVTQYSGIQTLFSVVAPTGFAPGAYSLQVRGLLVGEASAYAGTLQTASAVPVPGALPLLAAGLVSLAGMAVRRRRHM